MVPKYNFTFVTLSILVAIFASYVALDLASSNFRAKNWAKSLWLCLGSLAMGIGIWSMHFVGMEAFAMPGMQMAYDVPLMLLSVAIAVFASAIALQVVGKLKPSNNLILASGLAMAAGISGMHYTGMYSMRMAATILWNPWLVALSIIIALVASFAALLITIRLRESEVRHRKLMAAIFMGIAVSGMHYTGMFAATFVHSNESSLKDTNLIASETLGYAILVSTFVILALALAGAAIDRVLTAKTKKAEETAHLLAEAKLTISKLEEERALRERFVFALAHDLRTPLNVATMASELTLHRHGQDNGYQEVARAVDNLKRMDEMIQDLLDVHRVSAGEPLFINREKGDLSDLLKSVVENLTSIYGDRFVLESERSTQVNWNKRYMRRVIENLCVNAVKYGSEVEKIKIKSENKGDRIIISVNNRGPVLAQENQEGLFALFNRGRITPSKRGWGIGLTIVKGVVEAHSGKVHVESDVQNGTTFSIEIPQLDSYVEKSRLLEGPSV